MTTRTLVTLAALIAASACGPTPGPDGGVGGGGAGGGSSGGSGGGLTGGGAGGGAGGGGGGAGGGDDAGVNHPPVVGATIEVFRTGPVTDAGTLAAGEYVTLSITATDADADLLTFQWSHAGGPLDAGARGTFTSAGSSVTGWYPADVLVSTPYSLQVSVTDGRGAPIVRTIDLTAGAARFTDVYAAFLGATVCTVCHGGAAPANGMDLSVSQAAAYATLVNVDHNEHPIAQPTWCTGQGIFKRVAAGPTDAGVDYAAKSLLYLKITGTQPAPMCGESMPALSMNTLLPPYKALMLRSWINAGARDD